MEDASDKRSRKAGLEPGTLVHIGLRRGEPVVVRSFDYDATHFEERPAASVAECLPYATTPTVSWIDVEGVHDTGVIGTLGECFHVHPLTQEDIANTNQRPKVEEYDDYLFVVLKMLDYENGEITTEQVSLILGRNYVISFQEGVEGDAFETVRARLRVHNNRIRSLGADYLAYSLIDAVVDSYFGILENLGEALEDLEDELLSAPRTETLSRLHNFKRQLLTIRKSVWPFREVIGALGRGDSPYIAPPTRVYVRDVYDHTVQVIETVETYRDMLSGMMDIYLSSISNKLNEVMKVLTIIATIFIPLTFIAGVYGMNFEHMPEIGWRWGYFGVLALMAGVAVYMLLYFKRKRWL